MAQTLPLLQQQQETISNMLQGNRKIMEKGAKMESPNQFDGKEPPIKAYPQHLGNHFEVYPETSLERKRLITAGLLKGDALTWREASRAKARARMGLRAGLGGITAPTA